MNCNHASITKKQITKSVGSQIFKTEALVCNDCNALRWNGEIQGKFDKWLTSLPRDSFTVQEVKLTTNIVEFIEQKSIEFSGKKNRSAMVRAMISIWCNFVDRNNELADAVEREYDLKKSILAQDRYRENVRLSPKFYMQVRAQAELSEMSMQEFIVACVERISIAIMNEGEVKFYDIKNRLSDIVAAA
jgi:hypothetical protein